MLNKLSIIMAMYLSTNLLGHTTVSNTKEPPLLEELWKIRREADLEIREKIINRIKKAAKKEYHIRINEFLSEVDANYFRSLGFTVGKENHTQSVIRWKEEIKNVK